MPKPKVLGRQLPRLQSIEVSFDPTQGETRTEEWLSSGDNLGGIAANCRAKGIAYRYRSHPVKSQLVATETRNNATNQQAIERWELLRNQDSLDIREHPRSRGLGQPGLARVLRDVKRHEEGRTVDTSSPTPYTADQTSLFNLLVHGKTHYPIWSWVIRYTANIDDTFPLMGPVSSGVGGIYSTAQLPLPTGIIFAIVGGIPAPASDPELQWGWLKTAVQYTKTALNRVEMSCELILAEWPLYIYS